MKSKNKDYTTITVEFNTLKRLNRLKYKLGFSSIEKTIKYMLRII